MGALLSRPGSLGSQGGRFEWLAIAGLTFAVFLAPATLQAPTLFSSGAQVAVHGVLPHAIRRALEQESNADLIAFYGARGYRPLWIHHGHIDASASVLLAALDASDDDDLRPQDYQPGLLRSAVGQARGGDPALLAKAELALSRALVRYAADLRTPLPHARIAFSDPALQPAATDPRAVLEEAAGSPSLSAWVARLHDLNPIYDRLREALAASVRAGQGDGPGADLIRVNLERARGLPPKLGQRYVLVNAAAETVWMRQSGSDVGSMDVIVGKRSEPTPVMAGLIRYAVFHPYWNVPPDLVRDSIAPAVLREGPTYLAAKHLQVLSDWSSQARPLDPQQVDWTAVAAGDVVLRVRQTPGPDNMMGQVKFMFPNTFGVYLHDTPLKGLFRSDVRTDSSGCVRLKDAPELARWLLPPEETNGPAGDAPEQRVDLPRPTPVYILYFTLMPTAAGLRPYPDIYGRDPKVLADLAAAGRGPERSS